MRFVVEITAKIRLRVIQVGLMEVFIVVVIVIMKGKIVLVASWWLLDTACL